MEEPSVHIVYIHANHRIIKMGGGHLLRAIRVLIFIHVLIHVCPPHTHTHTHTHSHTHTHTHTGGAYRTVYRIMMDIVRKEGARHLMKGLLPRLIAVPMYMSVFFVVNEEMEKLFLGKRMS